MIATHTAPRTRLKMRLRLVALLHAPERNPHRPARPRIVLGWVGAAALLLNVAALVALDAPWPNLRDPEYGMRVARLRARVAENPNRPLVLVLGSSRTCMGVKPAAWEAVRPGTPGDPLLFNFGTVGAGPIQQLIALRRAYADGVRPAVVLLEYWPPVLRQDGAFAEQHRVGQRLRFDDAPVVRDYFRDPERVERSMVTARANPIFANRERWLALASPKYLAMNQHANVPWRELDRWGWLPGMDVRSDDAATRRVFLDHYRPDYQRQFAGHAIHPDSDRALRAAVAFARTHSARVGFFYLPESPEFQSWYPPGVERAAREHFAGIVRELSVPVIDARNWVAEDQLADGHHLSRSGAGAFTARFGRAVSAAFPAPGVYP